MDPSQLDQPVPWIESSALLSSAFSGEGDSGMEKVGSASKEEHSAPPACAAARGNWKQKPSFEENGK